MSSNSQKPSTTERVIKSKRLFFCFSFLSAEPFTWPVLRVVRPPRGAPFAENVENIQKKQNELLNKNTQGS